MHVFHRKMVSGGYDISMNESAYYQAEMGEIINCV